MSGGIFRSEKLNYYQVIIPKESAWLTVDEIGKLSLVHFDLNHSKEKNALERPFINQLKRIENSEQLLLTIYSKIEQYPELQLICPDSTSEIEKAAKEQGLDSEQSLNYLEQSIQEKLFTISQQEKFLEQQKEQQEYYQEQIAIIKLMRKTFEKEEQKLQNHQDLEQGEEQQRLVDRSIDSSKLKLDCVCGIIPKESLHSFQRLVFRVHLKLLLYQKRQLKHNILWLLKKYKRKKHFKHFLMIKTKWFFQYILLEVRII